MSFRYFQNEGIPVFKPYANRQVYEHPLFCQPGAYNEVRCLGWVGKAEYVKLLMQLAQVKEFKFEVLRAACSLPSH